MVLTRDCALAKPCVWRAPANRPARSTDILPPGVRGETVTAAGTARDAAWTFAKGIWTDLADTQHSADPHPRDESITGMATRYHAAMAWWRW